jgi:tight adherence protein B
VTALLLALLAAAGSHFLVSAVLGGRRHLLPQRRTDRQRFTLLRRARDWLIQAGLVDVRLSEFAVVSGALFAVTLVVGWVFLGGLVPALALGAAAATAPFQLYRARRAARLSRAQESWPRLIEEIRIHTLSLGRSVPQAVFEAGLRAPAELRPAFEAAHREWLLSVDFARTLDILRAQLADPTADAACETLLVAHEVGGTDLGRRLEALAEDRLQDALGRKDAHAKQAGVRFARRFVLVVPAGMTLAGSLIGTGRAAYASTTGQIVVLAAVALVAGCWVWAGRYLRLPEAQRVFRAPFVSGGPLAGSVAAGPDDGAGSLAPRPQAAGPIAGLNPAGAR